MCNNGAGMDLNQLAVFVEVVRAGSITAAARVMNLSKSTVSRRISNLEARLQTQLIQRTTRELHLTDVGAEFLRKKVRCPYCGSKMIYKPRVQATVVQAV